jgi:hypothetical protein
MKLHEVARSMKVDLLVSSITKLLAAKVPVMMVTVDGSGKELKGLVTNVKNDSYLSGATIDYREVLKNGALEDIMSQTHSPAAELEGASLKKQEDGTYVLHLPNLEAEA